MTAARKSWGMVWWSFIALVLSIYFGLVRWWIGKKERARPPTASLSGLTLLGKALGIIFPLFYERIIS